MSFGCPLPNLTSPVKVDHVFLLCFCLNSQNWTLESFGKSCFQPLNHCFYLLFSLCSAGHVVCPGKMPSVFPPPLPPPSPTSLLLRSLPLLILSLLLFSSFSLSLVSLHHLILLLFLPLPSSLLLFTPFPSTIPFILSSRSPITPSLPSSERRG